MAIDLEICSTALVLVGGTPITSTAGSGAQETACRHLYPAIVLDALSSYRWRFTQRQVQLSRLEAAPADVWEAAYLIPDGTVNIWAVKVNGNNIAFDRFGEHVLCNAQASDVVVAELSSVPPESSWPGYFRSLIEVKLAAALAVPIAEDPAKTTIYARQAEVQWARAKNLDAQMRTAPKINMGGLRRYHRGRP